MKHILIIGGTGMLRDMTTHFIDEGHIVSVLARDANRLNELKEDYPIKKGRILTISQDYRDSDQALKKIRKAADMFVYIDMAVLWIHDSGRRFSEELKEFLFSHHPKTKVYQLWGSPKNNPLEMSESKWMKIYPKRYREIFLGYKQNGSSSRWLTNREISEGTVQAIKADKKRYTIGTTDPWKSKP